MVNNKGMNLLTYRVACLGHRYRQKKADWCTNKSKQASGCHNNCAETLCAAHNSINHDGGTPGWRCEFLSERGTAEKGEHINTRSVGSSVSLDELQLNPERGVAIIYISFQYWNYLKHKRVFFLNLSNVFAQTSRSKWTVLHHNSCINKQQPQHNNHGWLKQTAPVSQEKD